MSRPRIAFVLEDALGWRTYKSRLETVLSSREDIETLVLPVSLSRYETLFRKRNNMRSRDHLFRRIDPIVAFCGRGGKTIRARLGDFRPEAVHFAAHWPAAALAGHRGAVPFSVTLDNTRKGIERDLPRGAWNTSDMEREARLLRAAAHVFPMSSWTSGSVVSDCGVDPGAVTVMPPSIEVSRFVPAAHDRPGGKLRVIFIGNDIARKGAADLARWISGPLAGIAELHVVSTDPAAASLAAPGIVLHGRVENDRLIGDLLPSMDVLCLPTRSDMSPQVLAEAAAAGLPAVASAIGGIPGMVCHGETGFTIAVDDEAEFIAALSRLSDDRELCRRMGAAARAHASASFDAAHNFNHMIDKLVVLAGSHKGRP